MVDGLKTSQNTTVAMDSVGGYRQKACNDGGSGRVCRRTPRYRILPQSGDVHWFISGHSEIGGEACNGGGCRRVCRRTLRYCVLP